MTLRNCLTPSVVALVVANLIPLYGVMAWGWEIFPLVLLFWLENVVIGVLNACKMLVTQPGNVMTWVAKVFLVPFFCFHYGMFTLVHGLFVLGIFGGQVKQGAPIPSPVTVYRLIVEHQLGWAVLALAGSHAFSFVWNFLRQAEYRTASLTGLMQQPYGRVVVMHLTILGGAFLIMMWRSPMAGLVLLVVLKITLDLRSHLREHRKPDRALPSAPDGGLANRPPTVEA